MGELPSQFATDRCAGEAMLRKAIPQYLEDECRLRGCDFRSNCGIRCALDVTYRGSDMLVYPLSH